MRWIRRELAELEKLWAAGLSAAQIAVISSGVATQFAAG